MKTLYLVTGAVGYLGGEVCRQLVERGLHGRALVLPGDKTARYIPREIEQCEGDLCDTASLERFFSVAPDTETIVLHCASMVALGNERRELVMKVNVQGTQNIIDQCFAHPECKKLVYVGSTGAIQELPHGQRMKEPECFVPEESLGVYGQSKAMASQLVLDAPAAAMDFFANDCPAKRMGDPEDCAALALFLASDLARYITGAAIPVDGALSAGHQNVSSWKHPEILTDGKLNSQSTIAALMENDDAKAVVEKFLPGFAANEQAKAAYGMTFGKIGPMLGLPDEALQGLLSALDTL